MMFDKIQNDVEKRMDASIQSSKSEMSGIRAGRASPSMLDSIKVEAYGQKMNINQVAIIKSILLLFSGFKVICDGKSAFVLVLQRKLK